MGRSSADRCTFWVRSTSQDECPVIIHTHPSVYRIVSLRWPKWVAVTLCGILGTLLPAAYGVVNGIRNPAVHDEFSYLLGADTFASGRLTNPPPALPEFFEAPHVLVSPTYSSKYPPGQAAALALGQFLFDQPIWGVWISCGLFAASICWMLLAWTSRPWAIAVTAVAIATLGTSTYWAQSYWGGMVAACGGALLFGGVRRLCREPKVSTFVLTGAGGFLLANSRPFEGAAAVLAAAMMVGFAIERPIARRPWLRGLATLAAVSIIGLLWIGYYNRAVTGSWTTMPYTMHTKQYFGQGPFLFSFRSQPRRDPNERLTRFGERTTFEQRTGIPLLYRTAVNFANRLPAVVDVSLGLVTIRDVSERAFYRPLVLWIVILVFAGLADRWSLFSISAIVFMAFVSSLAFWWLPHYSAPVVALGFATMGIALQRLTLRNRFGFCPRQYVPMLVVCCAGFYAFIPVLSALSFDALWRDPAPAVAYQARGTGPLANPGRFALARAALKRHLEAEPGLDLVFVRYDPAYPVGLEWVYNLSDLKHADVIFAHDLGAVKNRELVTEYSGRQMWLLTVSDQEAPLVAYQQ